MSLINRSIGTRVYCLAEMEARSRGLQSPIAMFASIYWLVNGNISNLRADLNDFAHTNHVTTVLAEIGDILIQRVGAENQ